eukprot:4176918-Lingulodinium_polyedra.AAC.1
MRRVERPENWDVAQAAWHRSRENPAADPEFRRCPFEPGGARDILESVFFPKGRWKMQDVATGAAQAAPASSASAGGR